MLVPVDDPVRASIDRILEQVRVPLEAELRVYVAELDRIARETTAAAADAAAEATRDAARQVALARESAAREIDAARAAAADHQDAEREVALRTERQLEDLRTAERQQREAIERARRIAEHQAAAAHEEASAARRELDIARARTARAHANAAADLEAFAELERAESLGAVLDTLARRAALVAARAAVLVCRGGELRDWALAGTGGDEGPRGARVRLPLDAEALVACAAREGRPIANGAAGLPASAWPGDEPDPRAVLACPIVVGGRSVAVLQADVPAADDDGEWMARVQLMARHAALVLEARTLRLAVGASAPRAAPAASTSFVTERP